MRVFLDTNVLAGMLDAERHDHRACKELLVAAEDGRISPVLTGMTVVHALYAVRKAGFRRTALMEFARYILLLADVASMDQPAR